MLTLAHGMTTLAAGAFGFLAVLGLRETMSAIMGQARFQRISAAVQAGLVVALATALLLLPGAYTGGVARNRLTQGGLMAKALPPLWFVGLHETLAGSVIDRLPVPIRPGSRPSSLSVNETPPTGIAARGRAIVSWRRLGLRRCSSPGSSRWLHACGTAGGFRRLSFAARRRGGRPVAPGGGQSPG